MMLSRRTMDVFPHAVGDEEILTPIVAKLETRYAISLRPAIPAHRPIALVTGLHAHKQKEAILNARRESIPTFGLIEMALPSARHLSDKKSCIHETICVVDFLLVPRGLVDDARGRRYPGRVISYGTPVVHNDWVVEQEGHWAFKQAETALDPSLARRIVFLGQHHARGGEVLERVAAAVRAPMALLRHPGDDGSLALPDGVEDIPRADAMGALRNAPLVITEYSNMGYSVALAGTPVWYVYEDPPGPVNEMRHLAVIHGSKGELPVMHGPPTRENAARALAWAARVRGQAPTLRPRLELGELFDALEVCQAGS